MALVAAAVALCGLLVPSANAAPPSSPSVVLFTGSQGGFYIAGLARVFLSTKPLDPCQRFSRTDPCRAITLVMTATASNGTTTCPLAEAESQVVPSSATKATFNGNLRSLLTGPCRTVDAVPFQVTVRISGSRVTAVDAVVGDESTGLV